MDKSGKPVDKSQGIIEKRDDKAGKISQDDILAGYQQAVLGLRDRIETLEARIKLNCPGCQEREDKLAQLREQIGQRLIDLGQSWNDRHGALETRLNCKHEPICLPSSSGPAPILPINIADARKMDIIAPGKPPPIAFAIALCRLCGMPYVFINKLKEAQPFEGGAAPIPIVRPGEPIQ